jgi:hypothetical protein
MDAAFMLLERSAVRLAGVPWAAHEAQETL